MLLPVRLPIPVGLTLAKGDHGADQRQSSGGGPSVVGGEKPRNPGAPDKQKGQTPSRVGGRQSLFGQAHLPTRQHRGRDILAMAQGVRNQSSEVQANDRHERVGNGAMDLLQLLPTHTKARENQ